MCARKAGLNAAHKLVALRIRQIDVGIARRREPEPICASATKMTVATKIARLSTTSGHVAGPCFSALQERIPVSRKHRPRRRIALREGHQHADQPHPIGLLCTRRYRPKGCCATKRRDQVAPPHVCPVRTRLVECRSLALCNRTANRNSHSRASELVRPNVR